MRGIGEWILKQVQQVLCSNCQPGWGEGGFEGGGSGHWKGREGLGVCRS